MGAVPQALRRGSFPFANGLARHRICGGGQCSRPRGFALAAKVKE